MGRDSLREGIARARLSGAPSTVHQTEMRAGCFVTELRQMGYGVQRWENLTNKHVAEWADRALASTEQGGFGHSVSTVVNYLSAVRTVAKAWGNDRIHDRNAAFYREVPREGLEPAQERIVPQREYVTNADKAVSDQVYQTVRSALTTGDPDQQRLAVQMDLMRHLGLRHEESRKFNPERDVRENGDVRIVAGTKGGRERTLEADSISQEGRAAIEAAKDCLSERGSLIPSGMSEREWESRAYDLAQAAGLSRADCGASFHGLRHGYAQDRYEALTGFLCPCRGGTEEQARTVAGDGWEKLDQDARQVIKEEMGHGPDRDSVVSVYLGSFDK